METSTKGDIVNLQDSNAGSILPNASLEYSLNLTHHSNASVTSLGNITGNIPLKWIPSNFNILDNTASKTEDNTATLLSQIRKLTNSTLLYSIQPGMNEPSGIMSNGTEAYLIRTNSNVDLATTAIPYANTGLSSMEKWFIATGSIIIAVIILFCLNTCIEYRGLFQKLLKRFRRRNEMVEMEKRCHRDRELLGGRLFDDSKTQTHIFLNRILTKHKDS